MRPAVALGVGIGAEQPEEVRAERAARRPRLLAATAASRRARRRAPPGSGCRRGRCPRSAPTSPGTTSLAGGHPRQDAVLLLLRAELEDRRREQEDAVLGDALRRAGAVVLLLEDQPLPEARLAAAVLARATTRPRSRASNSVRSHSRCAAKPSRGVARRQRPGGARSPRATPGTRRGTAPRRR